MENKKVLLIDDQREPKWITNPDGEKNRSNMHPKYTDEEVHVCRTTEIGLEDLVKQKWDVLLLDHDMGPGMSGMYVLYFLMDEENAEHMPNRIYLVTANIVSGPLMYEIIRDWKREGKIEEHGWIR